VASHSDIILLHNMLTDHLVMCQQQSITTLLHIHIIFVIRCIEAVGRIQKMQDIQCKHPSECMTVGMKSKQSVCIDVYDMKTAFMLKRVFDRLCNEKCVRLTVYGSNLYHMDINLDNDEWDIMNRVSKELCRICTRAAPSSTPHKSDIMKPCTMVE